MDVICSTIFALFFAIIFYTSLFRGAIKSHRTAVFQYTNYYTALFLACQAFFGIRGGRRRRKVEKMRKIRIAGLSFADASPKELAKELWQESRDAPVWVVTPNALMLERARRDSSVRSLLSSATIAVADGKGVALAARRKGVSAPAPLPGIALGEALLALAETEGARVFLLGGKDGVAAEAARRIEKKHPHIRICGSYWGYFEKNGRENDALIAHLNAVRAEILFVCLGFPAQEEWIAANRHRIPSLRIAVGLGGSLDVWAGRTPRAPRFVRALVRLMGGGKGR
jgi:N-acetylglucosaminyldiphosphoundecaprenol N-acetyl-beta-D-mannosaminyltransferase